MVYAIRWKSEHLNCENHLIIGLEIRFMQLGLICIGIDHAFVYVMKFKILYRKMIITLILNIYTNNKEESYKSYKESPKEKLIIVDFIFSCIFFYFAFSVH